MLSALVELDEVCFPADDTSRERAAPGEVERGIAAGRVLVAQEDGRLKAFMQWDRPSPSCLYLTALGVHPDEQSIGLGRTLLKRFLAEATKDEEVSITTVTGPGNLPMLRLLLSHGFVARRAMRDYFGVGKHRLYLQFKASDDTIHPDDRYLIPIDNQETVFGLLGEGKYLLTDVVDSASGTYYEISRFDEEDRSSLQADELSTGVSFASAILAGLTFLAAFAFGSQRYPDGILALLIVAVLTTTLSLIVYANASGELARLRGTDFKRYMKWGNLLSEYGGVLPFLLVLPLTFRQVTSETPATWAIAILFAGGLMGYELSPFALHARYPRQIRFLAPAAITALLPIGAAAAPSTDAWMWVWSAATVVVLAIRILIAVPVTFQESSPTNPSSASGTRPTPDAPRSESWITGA